MIIQILKNIKKYIFFIVSFSGQGEGTRVSELFFH